jgi:hypothetical protein
MTEDADWISTGRVQSAMVSMPPPLWLQNNAILLTKRSSYSGARCLPLALELDVLRLFVCSNTRRLCLVCSARATWRQLLQELLILEPSLVPSLTEQIRIETLHACALDAEILVTGRFHQVGVRARQRVF